MIYNFIAKLKGVDFKYKVEAENIADAKVKLRNHIKNSVDIIQVEKPQSDFIDFFNDMIKK